MRTSFLALGLPRKQERRLQSRAPRRRPEANPILDGQAVSCRCLLQESRAPTDRTVLPAACLPEADLPLFLRSPAVAEMSHREHRNEHSGGATNAFVAIGPVFSTRIERNPRRGYPSSACFSRAILNGKRPWKLDGLTMRWAVWASRRGYMWPWNMGSSKNMRPSCVAIYNWWP